MNSFPTLFHLGGENCVTGSCHLLRVAGLNIFPDPCDLLILESTYGNRLHGGREDRLCQLEEKLLKSLSDNGKVFIPAFALGRTQEILYLISRDRPSL